MRTLTRLFNDESGNALAEYSLLLATVSLVCVALMTTVGKGIAAQIATVASKLVMN